MQKKNIYRIVQSFAMIPLAVGSLPYQVTPKIEAPTTIPSFIELIKSNTTVSNQSVPSELTIEEETYAKQIDAYYHERDMPLEGYGEKMVIEAKKNGLDPFLIPSISIRESTGGIHACTSVTNSPFGYGSCQISYKTMNESIAKVSESLGGNNPKTAKWYEGKTTEQILKTYNPDSIIPGYSKQVIAIMNTMKNQPLNDDSSDQLAMK